MRPKPLILLVLLVFLWIFPLLPLSKGNILHPYIYPHTAFVEALVDNTHLDYDLDPSRASRFHPLRSYPAVDMTLLLQARVTGMPASAIQLLPLFGIIMAFMFFALHRVVLGSVPLAAILSLAVVSFNNSFTMQLWTLWTYSQTYAIFLAFLIVWFQVIRSKDVARILLLMLFFTAAFVMHHTIPVWMISVMMATNAVYFFLNLRVGGGKGIDFGFTLGLTLAFTVFFLSYNRMMLQFFIPRIQDIPFLQSLRELWNMATMFLTGAYPPLEAYHYASPIALGPATGLTAMAQYFLIFIPIIAFFLLSLRPFLRRLRERSLSLDTTSVFVLSLFLAGFAHVVMYLSVGALPLKYYSLGAPLLSVFCLVKLKAKQWLLWSFLAVLMALSLAKFGLSWQENFGYSRTTLADAQPGASWITEYSQGETALISDMHTFGKFLVEGAILERYYHWSWYDYPLYDNLVSPLFAEERTSYLRDRGDFVVVDVKSAAMPVVSLVWDVFEPLGPYFPRINRNINIHRNYDDGVVWLFRPRRAPEQLQGERSP